MKTILIKKIKKKKKKKEKKFFLILIKINIDLSKNKL